MKLFVKYFYIIQFLPKVSSALCSKTPSAYFLRQIEEPCFTPTENNRLKYSSVGNTLIFKIFSRRLGNKHF
jgi:hypothetical protein